MVHVNNYAVEFGERLREERERLGLSQGEFASKAGVHRNTQVRYETGRTQPLPGYLDTIKNMGVNTNYLFTGGKDEKRLLMSLEQDLEFFGQAFVDVLGIPEDQLLAARTSINQVMAEHKPDEARLDATLPAYLSLLRMEFAKAVAPLIARSRYVHDLRAQEKQQIEPMADRKADRFRAELDHYLLTDIIEGLERHLDAMNKHVSPSQKALRVASLYRQFRESRKIDQELLLAAARSLSGV